MNRSWIEQKKHLVDLLVKLSDIYGGEDDSWLQEYTNELIMNNRDNLGQVSNIVVDLINQAKRLKLGVKK